MQDIFRYDPLVIGTKGLLFVGDKVLVYRRDDKTNIHPGELDLPGGGLEGNETPFENFQREVKEEFGLTITRDDIVYARKYPNSLDPSKFGYFPVAKLSKQKTKDIVLGNEGTEFLLLTLDEYLTRDDAWDIFQQRASDYVGSIEN